MNRRAQGVGRRAVAASLFSVAGLAACDPSWRMSIEQPLTPASAPACVQATLRARPEIDSVRAETESEITFRLREPAVPEGSIPGWVRLERAADSAATFRLELWWHFPAADVLETPERTRQLAAFGREVAEQVRRACAPNAPSATSCRMLSPPLSGGGTCDPAV